jgi:hypothetical protein
MRPFFARAKWVRNRAVSAYKAWVAFARIMNKRITVANQSS